MDRIKMKIDGFDIEFGINDQPSYNSVYQDSDDDDWASIDLIVYSTANNMIMQYKMIDQEMLTYNEIASLVECLDNLINNSLYGDTTIRFLESDLEFKLHPEKNIDMSSDFSYVEMLIYFFYDNNSKYLTESNLTLVLHMNQIIQLNDYLKKALDIYKSSKRVDCNYG